MPRIPEKKKNDTVEDKLVQDRDFTLVTLPRPLYGVIMHLAFSPSIPFDKMGHIIAAQKTFHPITYVKGGGGTVQHLSNLEGYNYTSLLMLSSEVFVLVYYDRPEYDGFRYVAQAAMGIDYSGYYTPGYGEAGEVERITHQRFGGVKEEIKEARAAVKAQSEN